MCSLSVVTVWGYDLWQSLCLCSLYVLCVWCMCNVCVVYVQCVFGLGIKGFSLWGLLVVCVICVWHRCRICLFVSVRFFIVYLSYV